VSNVSKSRREGRAPVALGEDFDDDPQGGDFVHSEQNQNRRPELIVSNGNKSSEKKQNMND
jgi:hypothetical protein